MPTPKVPSKYELSESLRDTRESIRILEQELFRKERELEGNKKLAASIEEAIARKGKAKAPEVSDHAIARYYERVKGINRKTIEEIILSPTMRKTLQLFGGTGEYPSEDGTYKVVFQKNVAVTIKLP